MIPDNINSIYLRIKNCEDDWKALYMAAWGYARYCLLPLRDKDYWDKKIEFGLPASKKGTYTYTPKELYNILTSKDIDFTLGHLQTLFSLLEEIVKEICIDSKVRDNINFGNFEQLRKFLSKEKPFNHFKFNIDETAINELRLAKETRNCYIHNYSKIDNKWIDAFKKARQEDPSCNEGEYFQLIMEEVENWNNLINEIADEIIFSTYEKEFYKI